MSDLLAHTLSTIRNAEMRSKDEVVYRPASDQIKRVLEIFKKHGYVKDVEYAHDQKGGYVRVKLAGAINKVGVVKPRFPVQLGDYEKYEKRYLPAKDFGILIVSTPKGMMDHEEAKRTKQGGVLIAYVY